jgi:hypothetical protein
VGAVTDHLTACAADENVEDGAERGDDDLADQVVGAKPEQAGEKAADYRAAMMPIKRFTSRSCWRPMM